MCLLFSGVSVGLFLKLGGMKLRHLGYVFLWMALILGSLGAFPAAAQGSDIKSVVVAPVISGGGGERVRVTGSVFSRRYSKLSSQVEGLVSEVVQEKGTYVRKGEALCRIDATFAELDAEEAGVRVTRAKAALAEAQRQYDEAVQLSQERILAESDIESLRSQLRIAESELRRMEILHTRSTETLSRFELTAPFDGMIVSKETEEGEWIARGGTAVTIVELDVVVVEFLIPQNEYHRIDRSQDVSLSFDAIPGRNFSARIDGVIALASERSRAFPVRIELPNPDHAIIPGMSARGEFRTHSTGNGQALQVPSDAVLRTTEGRNSVFLVQESKPGEWIPVARSVALGARSGRYFLLESGDLDAGDQVVVRGNERLTSGEAISLAELRESASVK